MPCGAGWLAAYDVADDKHGNDASCNRSGDDGTLPMMPPMPTTMTQVLSYATIVRYLVYQQGKEIDLLVGTLRDHGIGTFTRSP